MQAIQIISQDLFDKVRSRFENLEMGDSTGAVTIDPKEARFFDFDFVLEGADLGRVSVSLGELGSLKVFYSQGITENKDDFAKKIWYSFLKEMRLFAMRRLLRFDTRDIAKTNLEQKDFQYLASKSPKEEPMSTMNESRWNQKSTKKTSRAVKGKTEVIVRHAKAVEETYPGARSQSKNIKAIFIQNADGERFKYPFIHPAGAFAMAQHVDHGGVPHDPAGKAIIEMSEQIAQLQEFSRHVRRATLHDDAMSISEKAMSKLNELKERVAALSKRHHYESWIAEFNEGSDDLMTELDAVTMEDYKSKFTQTNFQEELSKFFPLLHRIVGEANAVNLDELIKENEEEQDMDQDQDMAPGNVDPSDQFNNWADSVETGTLSNDQAEDLKQELDGMETDSEGLPKIDLGTDGTIAVSFFQDHGLDNSDLAAALQQAAGSDSTQNAYRVFADWATSQGQEQLVQFLTPQLFQEPEPQAPAVDQEQQPVSEAPEDWTSYKVAKILFDKGMKYTSAKDEGPLINAIGDVLEELGMNKKQVRYLIRYDDDFLADTLSALYDMSQQQENTDMVPPLNAMENNQFVVWYMIDDGEWDEHGTFDNEAAADAYIQQLAAKGYDDDNFEVLKPGQHPDDDYAYTGSQENTDMVPPPGAMSESEESVEEMVHRIVHQHFNEDNPNGGPFPKGEEGIAIEVKTEVEDVHGEEAALAAEEMARAEMAKCAAEWDEKHNGGGQDGLSRIREIISKMEKGMEGIGDQGHGGKDFNKNIMPAEGQGDLATALSKLSGNWSGWHKEEDMSTPEVDHYEYDDGEGGYYGRGTIEHNLKTGEVKVEYHDSENDMDVDGTFKNMGDAMRALRGDLGVNHGGKAPNFDRLGHRKQHGPDDLRKTDRTGRKGSLAGGPTNSLKRDIEFNKGKHGPKGPLPEMAEILRLAGLAK